MTKNATPLKRMKTAKRRRERQEENERLEQKRKAPPFAKKKNQNDSDNDNDTQEQELFSPSTKSPPKKKLKAIQEATAGQSLSLSKSKQVPPPGGASFIQSTPTSTNVSKPLPVRPVPFPSNSLQQSSLAAKGNNLNQFRRDEQEATDEEDLTTRGGDTTVDGTHNTNEDTDMEEDNDDAVVDQQLPSSIKVQLTLDTTTATGGGLGLGGGTTTASPPDIGQQQQHHDANRSNDPLSTTLAAVRTTPQHRFRPIRSQSESLGTPPPPSSRTSSSFLKHPSVQQPQQQQQTNNSNAANNNSSSNPLLSIYNQFVNAGDDDDDDEDGEADAFLASSTSSFARINHHAPAKSDVNNNASTANASQHQYNENGDDDDNVPDDAEDYDSCIHWRLGNRDILYWQGRDQVCLGFVFWSCLGIILLYAIGLGAKTFWNVHRLEYQQLHNEYQRLVDILVDPEMQPIAHQFCITSKDDDKKAPTKFLKQVLHSEQSRHSILQLQQQIVQLESELTWWKNDANAKEAQLLGFKDQHEQDWNSIMNECFKAMTVGGSGSMMIDNNNQDEQADHVRQQAYATLDEALRANGGAAAGPFELLREMQELNRILDESNEELMEENLEWQQNMQELYEAFQQVQEYRRQEHVQRAAQDDRFQEEYQTLLRQRNTLTHETRFLEQKTDEMKSLIQEDSRKRMAVWLGEGNIYEVELKLHFHDDDDHTFQYMTVELDGQKMPHSVFTFLSQVELGAYQAQQQQRSPSFWFSQVGNHKVVGLPTAGSLEEWSVEWPSLIFEETHDDQQVSSTDDDSYTVGWNGMGPELYISFATMDQSEQGNNLLFQRNAPFGRVTRGTAVIDRMYSSMTLDSSAKENSPLQQLVHPVSLISATIL
mmetsp:Transcript_3774/g.8654  ORF Transcript_3774/g.8654 Transcript_3774/m.8654 type:complete len:878 (+) Transcript_3774:69-2702(+)